MVNYFALLPSNRLNQREWSSALSLQNCIVLTYDPDHVMKYNSDFLRSNFELLDQSLYAYLEDRTNQHLPTTELHSITYQLATALSHLSSMGIVHANLRPDNIMVVDQHRPLEVKMIYSGLAHLVTAVQPGVWVQTTWYTEVMLHTPFNEPWICGLWAW